ncbi:uncharacterized protein METZ01_LOCUS120201 [marine metagenome]|uniref:Uncharacterized protein n=1 Tax=marine metagenome TaxID=408172 RepID=A0A381XT18_9ZZZZ
MVSPPESASLYAVLKRLPMRRVFE